jgi:hypothetical protein
MAWKGVPRCARFLWAAPTIKREEEKLGGKKKGKERGKERNSKIFTL